MGTSLAQDIITDVTLHPSTASAEDSNNKNIESDMKKLDERTIDYFTTNEWCDVTKQTLVKFLHSSSSNFNMKLDSMNGVINMNPHCSYDLNDYALIEPYVLDIVSSSYDDSEKSQMHDVLQELLKVFK